MSIIRVVVGISFFCLGIAAAIVSYIFIIRMIDEINRQREGENQIEYLGSTPPKMLRILKEYRSLYPNGRLRHYAIASFITMMAALMGTAICFHIVG